MADRTASVPGFRHVTTTIVAAECLAFLRGVPDDSIDAIVTDPPYELGFGGRAWDKTGIAYSVDLWRECLRVVRPGGHLASFGGARTYHRVACAVEDSGWEIRDSLLAWIYGSGFPKSLDVSKALDKLAGATRKVLGPSRYNVLRPNAPSSDLCRQGGWPSMVTAPATPEAVAYAGWGTALKPAHEPIILARKPLAGTVARNVLEHGTGGINVDACRVLVEGTAPGPGAAEPEGRWPANVLLVHAATCTADACEPGCPIATLDGQSGELVSHNGGSSYGIGYAKGGTARRTHPARPDRGGASRFFPRFEFEPLDLVPPFYYCPKASRRERDAGCEDLPPRSGGEATERVDDSAGLSSPRAGAGRGGGARNYHPTVKPIALMEWLCLLVAPPGGLVLDPFMGSGSTGCGAARAGFDFLGVDMDPGYVEIARRRIALAVALDRAKAAEAARQPALPFEPVAVVGEAPIVDVTRIEDAAQRALVDLGHNAVEDFEPANDSPATPCVGCGHPEDSHNSPIANGYCRGEWGRCGCTGFAVAASSAAAAPANDSPAEPACDACMSGDGCEAHDDEPGEERAA